MAPLFLYGPVSILVLMDILIMINFYISDNTVPENIENDIDKYYTKYIFSEIFSNYEYNNYYFKDYISFKDDIEKILGEDISIIREIALIDSIKTTINQKDITIMHMNLCIKDDDYPYVCQNVYVKGKLNKNLSGTLKVIFDENIPTGYDDFLDYFQVECNSKELKESILTPQLKETLLNIVDNYESISLYIIDDDFIIKLPIDKSKKIRHWKINRLWAKARYDAYINIYNVINQL